MKPHNVLTYLGVLAIPLVILAGLLGNGLANYHTLQTIEAAVVNNDEAVTVNGQIIPLGRQITAALVDSKRNQNFKWVIATKEKAQEGLLNGSYAAVVTIPKDFSKIATSLAVGKQPQQATIQVETSKIIGIAEAAIGQAVADAAVKSLNSTLTEKYLDKIYLGFNEFHQQFTQLQSGTSQLAKGTEQITQGLEQFTNGTKQIANGLTQIDKNSSKLSAGADRIQNGINQLNHGLQQVVVNSPMLRSGSVKLSEGLAQLVKGTEELNNRLAGIKKILQILAPYLDNLPDLKPQITKILEQINNWQPKLEKLLDNLQKANTYAKQLQHQLPEISAQLQNLPKDIPCPSNYDDTQCAAFKAGIQASATHLKPYTDKLQTTLDSLVTHINQSEEEFKQFSQLSKHFKNILTNLQQALANLPVLTPNDIKQKITQLLKGVEQLSTGSSLAYQASHQLATGINQYTHGVDKIADGMQITYTKLIDFVQGVHSYTNGVNQLAAGVMPLQMGGQKLRNASTAIADGAHILAAGVDQGTKKIPTYSKTQRENLAHVVANPINGNGLESIVIPDIPWNTLVVILSLWIGALTAFSLLPTIWPGATLSTIGSFSVYWQTLALSNIIITLVSVAGTISLAVLLPLPVLSIVKIIFIILLTGICFVMINHALVAWFDSWGRVISVAFAVISFTNAMTDNPISGAIAAISPLNPAISALRSIVVSGHQTALNVCILIIWLLFALLLGITAISRRRTVLPEELASL